MRSNKETDGIDSIRAGDGARVSSDLKITPELIEQLIIEAHHARAKALVRTLRWLAPASSRAVAIPELIVRHQKVRLYLFADAIARRLVRFAHLVGLFFEVARWKSAQNATELRGQLIQPLGSIRALAEILRDNPALSQEQRIRMLSIIVDQSDRFDRVICASLKAA